VSLPSYALRGPARLLLHYVGRRLDSHLIILLTVFAAVGCAIGAQYGVKILVDALGNPGADDARLWGAVGILPALVAGDNFLWRLAGWVATYAFVGVGGELRMDLFRHLSGHDANYFSGQLSGALGSRISTAASTAWIIKNSLTWTTIPPAIAVLSSIALLGV